MLARRALRLGWASTPVEWPSHLNRRMQCWSWRRIRIACGVAAGACVLIASPWPRWVSVVLSLALGAAACAAAFRRPAASDQALRESESKFRKFVEQSLVGLYVVQDGKIAYTNTKNAELLG